MNFTDFDLKCLSILVSKFMHSNNLTFADSCLTFETRRCE